MTEFVETLLKEISESVGCNIQHNGCPCNTCFHKWAEKDLHLSRDFGHLFWLVILALRGDYTEDELIKSNRENFEALVLKGIVI